MKSANSGRKYRKDTLLAHLGRHPEAQNGAVNPPVYHASTILSANMAEWEAKRDPSTRFDIVRYGLLGTPTTFALEEAVAAIEGGYRAMLTSSGLAAITTPLQACLKCGDHVLMVDSCYGPARNFCDKVLTRCGVETTYYDPLIGGDIARLMRPNTRVVYIESPGSLTFEVQDVPAIAAAAHEAGAKVLMDNTWASPYLFRSFEHGVDVSIHAATKYIVGHSDVILGAVITNEQNYLPVRTMAADLGHCAGPDDAYFALRAGAIAQRRNDGLFDFVAVAADRVAVALKDGDQMAHAFGAAARIPQVGIFRDDPEQYLFAGSRHHQRRMRLLHRLGTAYGVGDVIMAAIKREFVLGEHPLDDLTGLIQPVQPPTDGLEIDPKAVVLQFIPSGADSQHEAAPT